MVSSFHSVSYRSYLEVRGAEIGESHFLQSLHFFISSFFFLRIVVSSYFLAKLVLFLTMSKLIILSTPSAVLNIKMKTAGWWVLFYRQYLKDILASWKFLRSAIFSWFIRFETLIVKKSRHVLERRETLQWNSVRAKRRFERDGTVSMIMKLRCKLKLITSMNIPSTTHEPEQRVRIDSLFPLVFQSGEHVSYSEAGVLTGFLVIFVFRMLICAIFPRKSMSFHWTLLFTLDDEISYF